MISSKYKNESTGIIRYFYMNYLLLIGGENDQFKVRLPVTASTWPDLQKSSFSLRNGERRQTVREGGISGPLQSVHCYELLSFIQSTAAAISVSLSTG